MNDTDTSDEAATKESIERCDFDTLLEAFIVGWQECRRRAEAQMEEERVVRIRTEKMYGDLAAKMDEAERLAYFAGLHDAFGAMEDLFSEETCNVLWNIHSIRKAKETEQT